MEKLEKYMLEYSTYTLCYLRTMLKRLETVSDKIYDIPGNIKFLANAFVVGKIVVDVALCYSSSLKLVSIFLLASYFISSKNVFLVFSWDIDCTLIFHVLNVYEHLFHSAEYTHSKRGIIGHFCAQTQSAEKSLKFIAVTDDISRDTSVQAIDPLFSFFLSKPFKRLGWIEQRGSLNKVCGIMQ